MLKRLRGLILFFLVISAVGVSLFYGIGFYLSPQDHLITSDVIVAISGGDTAARTREAVALYQAKWAPRIIFSGAALDPNSPSNAAAMAKAAQAQGVPQAAIELDETAVNTRENAAGVAAIVARAHYRSIILVTSPYHQRRAAIVFRRAMSPYIAIINHSSYDQTWRRSHWWATAYSRTLTLAELQKTLYELMTTDH